MITSPVDTFDTQNAGRALRTNNHIPHGNNRALCETNRSSCSHNRRCAPSRSKGFTLVEILIALTLTTFLALGMASALNASFVSYASATELAHTQMSSRMVMNKLLSMTRRSTAHDAYDPSDSSVTLLPPTHANYPLQTIGIQMMLPDESAFCVWWTVDASYNDTSMGDLWYQNMNASGTPIGTPEIMLQRVSCQWTSHATPKPYIFTLGSRVSDAGLLLTRATLDLTVQTDTAAMLSAQRAKGTDTAIRLVSSTMPRKTMNME